ncbi:MAG TPA: NAD(P)/FAD-dependent oxidoreductase [Nevskiaceae bacterium]|nr:NAD(P)/FAD-dependent oxidoreductase [Nevskiaceae bacterium]
MAGTFDVVVIGAGSNSLVAAAYMAKAGKKVLVLEKNAQCGGGVVSISIAPGFLHDPHAVGYYTCLANPVLAHDELGLIARHGLEFIKYDASFTTIFEDQTSITAFKDLDRSCADIAKFSEKDAETFRRFVGEAKSILPLLNRGACTPPLPAGRFLALLESSALGRRLAEAMFQSCYDLVDRLFENEDFKIHLLKWCAEAMENPETKGTGLLLYNLLGVAYDVDPVIVKGGSRNFTNALIRCIEAWGGTVRTGTAVRQVTVSGGRARGVLTHDEHIEAKEAVIACIHPWRLQEFIPDIDAEVAAAARHTNLSHHGAMNQQIALSVVPEYKAGPQFLESLGVEFVRKGMEATRRGFDEYRYGRFPPYDHLSPLAIMASVKDPSRAPPGQCALYLYHFAPMVLADGGLEGWDGPCRQEFADAIWSEFKRYFHNLDDAKIVARHIETPLDHHRHSGSMMHGDIFGIGTQIGQLLGRRPTPELAQYAVPGIEGLYLTGPFMHPGGTVTLGGRATAIRMYRDMGIPLGRGFEAI